MVRRSRIAFTLIELLVVISIIALLIAILLPALGAARLQARIMQNATHQRGLHQAFVIHGESNDGLYPGLEKRSGEVGLIPANRGGSPTNSARRPGQWPAARFAVVVDEELVSPDYVINPADPAPREAWSFGKTGKDSANTNFDWHNFSYAVEEWNGGTTGRNRAKVATATVDDMGSQTPVITDRVIYVQGGSANWGNIDAYVGVFSKHPGEFKMGLAWNDGHTTIENTPINETRFGKYQNHEDNIFVRERDQTVSSTPAPTGNEIVHSKVAYRTPSSHQSDPSERP